MSFFTQHIQRIIDTYEGHPPLALFLRQYFKTYPKLGSRDRRALSEAAYIYFRCRKFFKASVTNEEVLLRGYRLCGSTNVFLAKMLQDVIVEDNIEPSFQEDYELNISEGMTKDKWLQSMWQQPELFIRLRKNKEASLKLLAANDIAFEEMQLDGKTTDTVMISNGKAIDTLLPAGDFVVQDWSSQNSIYILQQYFRETPAKVWDVCSGAGGKSILMKDSFPKFDLTVSDVREAILHNLSMRFKQYELGKVSRIEVDSTLPLALQEKLKDQQFDLVLCDAPCSGSGTWARTPEQFHFFKPSQLQKFKDIQFPIAKNASHYVKQGGLLAYITCSVFKEENENLVQQLAKMPDLILKHQQIIDGIDEKADCMFIAVFEKIADI